MSTLPMRLDRIKSGYTDGARQLATRAVRVLSESRVTPNQLTALGFGLNLVSAVLIYREDYILAAVVFLIGSIIDILDGALARSRNQATTFGAFIDSTTDRISEGAVLCAAALVFASHDDTWAVIGTTNVDNRSFEHNDEVNVAFCDHDVATRLRQDFETDLAQSTEITHDAWLRRPLLEKALKPLSWLLERQQ